MSSEARTYGGRSGDERAQGRRMALIEAALDVAEDVGWHRVTVDRVRDRARLSKRYFYESFDSIDALAAAVVEHVAEGAIALAGSLPDEVEDVPALAHATVGALVRYLTDDPRRARVLFGDLAMTAATGEQRARAVRRIADVVDAAARDIHRARGVTDPLIATAAALLVGGTGQAILSWLRGEIAGSREQLIDNLTTLWLITGDGAAARLSGR